MNKMYSWQQIESLNIAHTEMNRSMHHHQQ